MSFTQQYRDLWLISILLRLITGSISAALSAKAVAYLIPEVSGALGMVAGFALFVCVEYVGKDSLAGKLSWELTQTPRYPAWIVGIWLMFIACFALLLISLPTHYKNAALSTQIRRRFPFFPCYQTQIAGFLLFIKLLLDFFNLLKKTVLTLRYGYLTMVSRVI